MKNYFVCLGFNVDKKKRYVTGLAMMHDLFISILRDNGYFVKSISLNSKFEGDNAIGNPGISRYFEYFSIIFSVIMSFSRHRHVVFYFNPSTNKAGFFRDVLLVTLAKLFRHKVLMQQFGALFESFRDSLNWLERKMLNWAYNKADVIIVEGEYAKDQYSFIHTPQKIKVVQNGLPEKKKDVVKTSKVFLPNETFKLFFMNNMIESKGYIDVLKAVEILVNERHKDVICTFAGKFMTLHDDEYFKSKREAKEWFEKYIIANGLQNRVFYHEGVFDEKKAMLFNESHVFLLPSYYVFEGQPTAILEALSYGCVPIVTRYRLIPDMVDENCGLFVEKKSPKAIADSIESLLNNPGHYQDLSRNGYNRFNERFTQEAYAQKIINIVNSL